MAQNQTEVRLRSRTVQGGAALSKFRVAKQGADSATYERTATQAAAVTDVPLGITRNAITSGGVGSVGQEGEFPVEVAAAVAVNDRLIVDDVAGIGRVKPVGSTLPPYWEVGIARTLQGTIGGICQVDFAPKYVPALSGSAFGADGHRQMIGPWVQDNVAASQAAVALGLGSTGKPQLAIVMTRAGSLVGVSVFSSVAAAGSIATLTVTKNGVATTLTVTLDASINGGLKNFAVAAKDAAGLTFAAGDTVGVTVTTDGSWSATTADINVEVQFED